MMLSTKKSGGCCSAIGCSMRRNTNLLSQVKMHRFPADPVRRTAWCNAIRRANWFPTRSSLICNAHFLTGKPSSDPQNPDYVPSVFKFNRKATEEGQKKLNRYEKNVKRLRPDSLNETSCANNENSVQRLKPSAIPSLLLPKSSSGEMEKTYLKNKASLKVTNQQENRNMDYISCSVPGCQSKSHRKIDHNNAEENILMFPVPHAGELLNRWKEALKGTNIKLTAGDYICELHFLENDINRCYRTKTSDGDIIEIKHKLPKLKPDAVPIKFLKPLYSVRRKKSKKQLAFHSSAKNFDNKTSLSLNSCDSKNNAIDREGEIFYELPANSIEEQISHKTKCLLYNELVKNIQLVKKPSKSWSVVAIDEFTIFARWNNKFIAEKRIVIENPLTVKVFLKDWEIEMTDLVDLTTIDDVSLLLEKVENYNMD